jgi:hypothetical protein
MALSAQHAKSDYGNFEIFHGAEIFLAFAAHNHLWSTMHFRQRETPLSRAARPKICFISSYPSLKGISARPCPIGLNADSETHFHGECRRRLGSPSRHNSPIL